MSSGPVFRADTAEVQRFGAIEARWIVDAAAAGASAIALGRAVYPPGAGIGLHRHPNAEEVVVVLSGRGEHVVGDETVPLRAGDVCFVPRLAPHALVNVSPDEDLVILWAYGGAASLEAAGYEELPDPSPATRRQ